MDNIKRLYSETNDFVAFAYGYVEYLAELLKNKLDMSEIKKFVNELETAREDDCTIYFAGNGGSAATASHIVNDIGIGVLKKGKIDSPFRCMALTDNVPVMTAIGNDDGYENIFVNQLRVHYRQGDKLVVISASGNSSNVVLAAEWVKIRGGKVIGILGFDGGRLRDICDIVINVETPKGEYGPVEDVHMIIDHMVSNWLINKMKAETNNEKV